MARTTWLTVLLTAFGLIMTQPSSAEEINLARITPGRGRFHLAFGLDPAALTTLGYSRGFDLGSTPALWSVDLSMPVAKADANDLRTRVGLETTLWQAGEWRVAARGRLVARSTSNSVYDGAAFGADLTSHLGYYRSRWFLAGMIGYDRTLVMHIEHTDWYRATVYEDAVDGWYRGAGGILHGGLAAGVTVGFVEAALRVELRRLDGGAQLMPPFVGEASLTAPF